ncbi:hypothetical protein, partial [Bacillus toyonensis]|uniref:hypothetical protein n=1 Tax=Bacillus toyonensis TaxID=155322 RepID=UPI000BEDF5F3
MNDIPITAVSRFSSSLDVWWIWENGSIQGATWKEGKQWQQYELAPAGSAKNITALSRHRNNLEVWWIGEDGSVQGATWEEGGQWQRYELAPAGSAARWSYITAVSKIPGSIDVFWNGPNFSIQGATWKNGFNWYLYQVSPVNSNFGELTAVSRRPGIIDIFWIGTDQSIQGATWEESGGWKQYQIDSSEYYSPVGKIVAVSTTLWSIDVMWCVNQYYDDNHDDDNHDDDNHGRRKRLRGYYILGATWEEGGQWQQNFFVEDISDHSCITTLSRHPGSKEVFWIGKSRTVEGNAVHDPIAPSGSALGTIVAVSRFPGSIDVIWIVPDGSVQRCTKIEGGNWEREEIAPPPPPPP